jgi:hypothetical protein
MKKLFIALLCFLSVATIASAQSKTKVAPKVTTSSLQKMLKGTGLPATMINDSLAFVPYEGENIESYKVAVQQVGDLYIVYTSLSEALQNKIDETKFKYLLQQNDHFDIVKVGLSSDGAMYVRADVYRMNLNAATLSRIIKQVANVTNIIAGEMKQ